MVGVQGAHPWLRSKALLGSIAGITRDRVNELQNPQPNQPLAAHFRVSSHCLTYDFYTILQFCYAFLVHVDTRWHLGVFPRSNKEAWEHASLSWMLSDSTTTPVLVVDMLPNRYYCPTRKKQNLSRPCLPMFIMLTCHHPCQIC